MVGNEVKASSSDVYTCSTVPSSKTRGCRVSSAEVIAEFVSGGPRDAELTGKCSGG